MGNARGLFLLLISALCLGCARYVPATDEQRAASFKQYADLKINDQPLADYMRRRTALVLNHMNVLTARANGLTLFARFELVSGEDFSCSHAVAIAHDGYFLTAAHCLSEGTNYLVYSDGQRARIAIPRIVASVNDEKQHRDIAILHVDDELPEVFSWCDDGDVAVGKPVVAVGRADTLAFEDNLFCIREVCLAGKLIWLQQYDDGMMAMKSDTPIRKGDSGGPLVTPDGKLIGLNSYVIFRGANDNHGGTRRPDRGWIARMIEADRAANHTPPPSIPSNPIKRGERALIIALRDDPNIERAMRNAAHAGATSNP
jgi:S1-C subfamily serine protease